ncbi:MULTISPECIES: cytochrome P450 family protein [Streptomyces]|uniref:Cytochrome P450 hydroxylase n=1 Tax=Streptomyces virginiae TaxID=1961 RepID=A0ABQ3NWK4_STRVG|nr:MULTISPECIES: cytochrome P450 [Streptomyces]KOU25465.1 cytochrome P450 [Streptomyces sp. WM6349]KOU90749.1 cytochrome P450 [Streptomyces sp. XY593]KOV15031.1 cytochrome P450 [Streptomyces sp. XY511]KOV44875.1 cytochrome P450 [Streptomyces sp. H036]MBP2344501.1 cytochrome P450 [Streptomyces virginiae]
MHDQSSTPSGGAAPELFTWEFATDPYPAYAWLRENSPVHRTKLPSGVEAWLVTRYADARQALADQRLSKNPAHHAEPAHAKGKTGIPGERKAELMTHLLNIDPPDHTRLRRLVSKAFTPRRVAEFAPRVQALTDHLIDGFAERGEADLIHEFAFPLPIYAICEMLGVPREDQDDFRDWAGMMIRHGGGPRGGVARSVKQMRTYLGELIHRKRDDLGDDLISDLIRASDHGDHLTEGEATAMAFILLFAGFETTVNLIGNGVHSLFMNPGQRERLQNSLAAGESGLLATGVEELLRYDGPVELATWRFATEPLTLGGERVETGDPVLVVLAAADRDPERFADPDTLDLSRADNQHLGYGHGIHYCLGAPLARLEGQTALATLLTRLPDLELSVPPQDLRWRGGLIMRGLRTLPVRFTAQNTCAGSDQKSDPA